MNMTVKKSLLNTHIQNQISLILLGLSIIWSLTFGNTIEKLSTHGSKNGNLQYGNSPW